jgi:phosphoglycolate phosphatase-like HAD superfamily hydrolase
MPGTIKLLSYLKSKEVAIGVATTKPTHLANEILSHINLIDFFDIVQGSELVQPKPSSEVFLLLESKLASIPKRKFAIGDRVSDMKASISAGYHSTLLNSLVAEIKDEGFSLSLRRRYNRVSTLQNYETKLRKLLEGR